jgi:hypothetical protein
MRRIALTIIICAMAVGIISRIVAYENDWIYIFFSLAMLTGFLMWALDVAIRIRQGKVKLRPFDALKKVGVIFGAMVATQLVFAYFSESIWSWQEALLVSGISSAILALWSTAYRKSTA